VNKQSMRGFLAMVERDFPDEILRIREPVRRELDITSTVFELERAGRSPIVFFERAPPCLLRFLPAGANRRVGLHPLESAALSRRTPIAVICPTQSLKPQSPISSAAP
jgi:hypothetical protein